MAERKREEIEENFVKLKGMTMDQLRIAAAGPGQFASDARLEITVRVAEAQMSAAIEQSSASRTTSRATIGLVVATLLLGLTALLRP
jgi:hypothetical protein